MSWGERSCKHSEMGCKHASYETCNVDCDHYEWNGVTPPDSLSETATPLKQKERKFPQKYIKLMKTKRWLSITRRDANGNIWLIGLQRKSNGERRMFKPQECVLIKEKQNDM